MSPPASLETQREGEERHTAPVPRVGLVILAPLGFQLRRARMPRAENAESEEKNKGYLERINRIGEGGLKFIGFRFGGSDVKGENVYLPGGLGARTLR